MEHKIKINKIEQVTHDVKRFQTDKPKGFKFTPGHATEVSINKDKWKAEKRPFTFTCLNEEPHLEFTIKIYPEHDGVTEQLGKLKEGDELIIRDTWGAIDYKKPGYIIAGGAGITPYIAILRKLNLENKAKDNKLFFSNKTDRDIILKEELDKILGENATYVITDQDDTKHYKGYIDEAFLKDQVEDFDSQFYVCGPPKMTKEIKKSLEKLGASADAVMLDDQ